MESIEKHLSATPVPRLRDGLHRADLKRELLARIQTEEQPAADQPLRSRGDLSLSPSAGPWTRIMRPQWIAAAVAVAVVTAILVVKQTFNRAAVEPHKLVQGAEPSSSIRAPGVALQPPPMSNGTVAEEREMLGERSLEQGVADAQVIVVATALDFASAPSNRPGELPENLIRFQVTRVLKGNLGNQVITKRTPTAANEFIGKEWVILLSAEYMAGKHQYADCNWIKVEPEVMAILSKGTR